MYGREAVFPSQVPIELPLSTIILPDEASYVMMLWAAKDTGRVEAVVGPYKLYDHSFRTLQGNEWLSDEMKFPVVEKWACPVNVGAHWILVVVDIPLKKIILMDPFGNEASYERRILRNWRNFMKQRGDDENRATWTVATLQHNKQRDGSSCGVFILKFAEHLLSEGDISRVQTTSDFVTNARLEIACSLLEYQGPMRPLQQMGTFSMCKF
ncbi:uncharacterized protein LOC125721122 isoform X2 [Brienomyrus brachyistius]|uniref:uncharacterized protein LOC125721122 isoform X2 n=1 Tax=Brienomyrus brachyistius TaxID=42636 RepID=UPI0020B2928A|nr:uncharacterized protein LOC125721122 isoform X2 [Brienomyrus brachyistius]